MNRRWQDKMRRVTDAARGIGAATAKPFSEHGDDVRFNATDILLGGGRMQIHPDD